MSRPVGDEIPDPVVALFDGRRLVEQLGKAHLMITVDADGLPRPCMLSAGEVLVVDSRTFRVGVWSGSGTSRNLAEGSSVLLCVVDDETVLYLRGRGERAGDCSSAMTGLDVFEISVDRVETDSHEGFAIQHGMQISLGGSAADEVLVVWQTQLETIRSAASR